MLLTIESIFGNQFPMYKSSKIQFSVMNSPDEDRNGMKQAIAIGLCVHREERPSWAAPIDRAFLFEIIQDSAVSNHSQYVVRQPGVNVKHIFQRRDNHGRLCYLSCQVVRISMAPFLVRDILVDAIGGMQITGWESADQYLSTTSHF